MKLFFAVAVLSAISVAVPGCGGPSGADFCDAQARCEGWTPAQYNDCRARADSDEAFASRFGCGPFLDQLLDCEDATGFCSGGRNFETNCGRERDNFNHCIGK